MENEINRRHFWALALALAVVLMLAVNTISEWRTGQAFFIFQAGWWSEHWCEIPAIIIWLLFIFLLVFRSARHLSFIAATVVFILSLVFETLFGAADALAVAGTLIGVWIFSTAAVAVFWGITKSALVFLRAQEFCEESFLGAGFGWSFAVAVFFGPWWGLAALAGCVFLLQFPLEWALGYVHGVVVKKALG